LLQPRSDRALHGTEPGRLPCVAGSRVWWSATDGGRTAPHLLQWQEAAQSREHACITGRAARRGYDTELGKKAVATGHADAIAFGRRFLATPDMVKRVELGAPLNQYHRETFYTQDQARAREPGRRHRVMGDILHECSRQTWPH